MNEQPIGLLGATSLVGECLLQKLTQERRHIIAFSRHPVVQNHPQVTWQRLSTIHLEKISAEKNKIPTWLCVAPIWILPEYFNLLLAYGARRIVVLSSTSRFTKNTSSEHSEREIALQLIKGEELVQAWATTHTVEWIILRPTLIYGYGRDKNVAEIIQFIRRFGFFPILVSGQGLRQPIHVEDVALACSSALSTLNLTNRSYNVTGGETLSYREMIKHIFAALGRTPRILTVPLWLFQIATWGLRWLPRYQHWTAAMAERMNQDLVFDSSDARRDLNFFPRSFKLTAEDLPSQNR
ncbi:nucleoside-diphosphate-sugar epimerase [Nitrosomonas sp. Nm84]|uniref:NAD-dependent epimerase/dehydratase family protein n=1 Tax=Nitrosomonas sp. Nm84 TaxID=200124 RepID=UPI000D770824|nr:NAD(P)-dependent oxidoreductase [Nitrosomonas sp. Nm84]PXW87641.1 nucleoside-diphosphate-sugar epimerase [Nitrosomonas sp. Nm84]